MTMNSPSTPIEKKYENTSNGGQNYLESSPHFFLKQIIRCLRLGLFESLHFGVLFLCFYALSAQGKFLSASWTTTQDNNKHSMNCDFRSYNSASMTSIQLLININEANEAELTLLPHIGPSLANRIILYRSSMGPFQKVEDLQNVKGIGPRIVNQVKDYCTVE